jgi:hypothetical protein
VNYVTFASYRRKRERYWALKCTASRPLEFPSVANINVVFCSYNDPALADVWKEEETKRVLMGGVMTLTEVLTTVVAMCLCLV